MEASRIMVQFETEFLDVIQRAHDVKSFRFKIKDRVDFKPGQFFFVGIKINNDESTKHFSFSNSPTETGYIEFTKRITSSEFSKALSVIEPGNWAKIKMPYGSFTFEGEYEKIAFLSGGIGITPIRSICAFVRDKNIPADIVLLYGNNREEDIVFREDFDDFTRTSKNIKVVYTLTAPDMDKNTWRGRTGYISPNMIREEIPDYQERVFYLCGPPRMVDSLINILKKDLGIKDDKIKTENFTGY